MMAALPQNMCAPGERELTLLGLLPRASRSRRRPFAPLQPHVFSTVFPTAS